jgi:IS5 family transposase
MLRLRKDQQPTLWESVLPPELFHMNEELSKVDKLLDDDRFFVPFKERFSTRMGRPTIPVDTYLRMMYLKHRYQLGYEILVKEVSDSFAWRCFCRLSLEDPVPDDTTLIKLTRKYGANTLRELNDAIVMKLKEEKFIRGRKLRLDTTVTEANIHYPTDSSLLADGIKVVGRTVTRLKKLGARIGNKFVNHTRKAKKVCLSLVKVLRQRVNRNDSRVVKANKELAELAEDTLIQGQKIKKRLAGQKDKSSRTETLEKRLGGWLDAIRTIVKQTREVLAGNLHLPGRVVSIFDAGARPIRKGKVHNDTEFGRKVLIGETDHGIITTYQVVRGNPPDVTLLKSGVRGHRRLFRKRLRAVATDRGFYSGNNVDWLKGSEVKHISIPVRGKAKKERQQEQKQSWFKRLQRFRAGLEARISLLKRKFGLRRSLMLGDSGSEVWVGQGIFTYNLWQAARIM